MNSKIQKSIEELEEENFRYLDLLCRIKNCCKSRKEDKDFRKIHHFIDDLLKHHKREDLI